jgi:uncharacterized protein
MIHPHTELHFISDQIGYGVVATRLIPRGTIVWAQDALDQTLSPAQIQNLGPAYRDAIARYCYVDRNGNFVLCWDLARYMNHSCAPSCRGAGYNFEIAVRDILPGEELTDDYGSLNLDYGFACLCNAPQCRRQIRPTDYLVFADRWDRIIADAFRQIPTVPQPLWPLVQTPDVIEAVLAGTLPIASCLENYHASPPPDALYAVPAPPYPGLGERAGVSGGAIP